MVTYVKAGRRMDLHRIKKASYKAVLTKVRNMPSRESVKIVLFIRIKYIL